MNIRWQKNRLEKDIGRVQAEIVPMKNNGKGFAKSFMQIFCVLSGIH
jgi:hypothetical protein